MAPLGDHHGVAELFVFDRLAGGAQQLKAPFDALGTDRRRGQDSGGA
jgi:hypothetical protein